MLESAARDDVAPFYPTSNDQVQYLTESYIGFDLLRTDGVPRGTLEILQQPRAQGMLAELEAATVFLATGPGRLAALDLNVAFFLVYIGVTALVVRHVLGLAPAVVTVGLILSAKATTALQGGVFDFRLDFQAMCLWGTLVVLVVLGVGRFAHPTRLTVGLSLLGVGLCLTRIIATTYLGLFLGTLLVLSLFVPLGRTSTWTPAARWRCLLVPLAASMIAATWFIVQQWTLVSGYYIGHHVEGDEGHLRALQVGVTDLLSSLAFYPVSLLVDQAGRGFVLAATLVVLAALAILIVARSQVWHANRASLRWTVSALVLAFLAPYAALTPDEAKSTVVSSAFLPALVLSVVLVFAAGCRVRVPFPRARRGAAFAIAGLVLIFGLGAQWQNLETNVYDPQHRGELAAASQLMLDLGDYVQRSGHGHATWASDAHLDFTPPGVARVYYYEQHHVWLDLTSTLGDGPITTTLTRDQVLQQAAASDILILTVGESTGFPYDSSVDAAKSQLFDLAHARYTQFDQFSIRGIDVFAFVRTPQQ